MRYPLLIALLLAVSTCKSREERSATSNPPKKPVLTVAASEPIAVARGRSARARITATVAEGYHVQANPPSQEYLVPVELRIQDTPTLHLGLPIYPSGKPHRIEGESAPLSTYEGSFEVLLPIDADLMAPEGEQVLRGELSYQACDNRRCLFPTSVPIEIPVRVTALR